MSMLFMAAIMAFLHHLAAFTVVSTLAIEVALFKPPLTLVQARRLQIVDSVFGISAGLLLVIGMGRFHFEKGAAYYFHNPFFLTKFGLFLAAALISIYPTLLFLSWRKDIKAGVAPAIDPAKVRKARMCMMLELTAIVGILFCAPMMARGL